MLASIKVCNCARPGLASIDMTVIDDTLGGDPLPLWWSRNMDSLIGLNRKSIEAQEG